MSTTSNSTSGSRPTSRQYNTGFPDSFATWTTSMRHPDAIIDPDFAISSEHIDPAKTLHRSRKSLLHKHRRTISHGKITAADLGQDEATHQSSMFSSTSDSTTDLVEQKSDDASTAAISQSAKAGSESSNRTEGTDNFMRVSPGFQYTADEERRRSKIFRKLMNKN
ncbi:hypothetical protein HD806DRAFT_536386 [Xylariaceae sp. AK1471]|nr:hypothetical protein HD806DRAFT_536386 [Xylariaceae sp. AK1471]